MVVHSVQYEWLLATCSHYDGALALLKQHRPYLEAIPSMRRPQQSIITLPLPNARVRQATHAPGAPGSQIVAGAVVMLPCDLVFLMCDPEWKIKTGVEIFVYIHRPQEDFSGLLSRWRQTQILMDRGYEWLLPSRHHYLLNDGADASHPLFVVFPQTPERIVTGLRGAGLPVVGYPPEQLPEVETSPELNELTDIPELEDIDPSSLEAPDRND
ncbi:hypothetical protein XM38_040400 [Halomicronema hongdechloris C2206]|uniref:Uncharacterized protein n=1 Tax=Halomicronema hongdechloris C2206 TaxID=1641165 RepID=A0A1Z3HS07_9CYAN|nr:hypothetical protein [Halomicronema hongdechloris]ASC73078.1 hypothetical protein XM38_040400 [Halomicronema hongdechloris C2206]